jgi:predicted nucleic-acid-binding protein
MIGLDTNVVVRYLTRDDPTQWPLAVKLIRSLSSDSPGFLSLVVLAEIVWVLEDSYSFRREQIEEVVDTLLRSRELLLEQAELVRQALRTFGVSRADFADCLIEGCAQAAGCSYTATFDRKAATTIGMHLLN